MAALLGEVHRVFVELLRVGENPGKAEASEMRKRLGDLQDGLLAHYQAQARASDVNVEARLEKEPFDWRDYLRRTGESYPGPLARVIHYPPKD